MEKYSSYTIKDIIELSKKNPKKYLSCLQKGMFSAQLDNYFVALYRLFKDNKLRYGFKVGDVYNLLSVDQNFDAKIIYAPWARAWARDSFIEMLNNYWKGPQVLDIQLGGACNLNCPHCDSPDRHQINAINLKIIQKLIEEYPIKQIYICGLGEPTEKSNLFKLKEILQMAKQNDIKVSMFTNLLHMDDELFDYLANGPLNILYNHNSDDPSKIQKFCGCSSDDAQKILSNRKEIMQCIRYNPDDRTTNIGASIIPMQGNIKEIPGIVEFCIENGIFPLVAEPERAGKASEDSVWKELPLSKNELLALKHFLKKHGIENVAFCPASVLSTLITNMNFAVAANNTGASCPWSELEDPTYYSYAFLPESTKDLWYKLGRLREQRLPSNMEPWLRELELLGVPQNIIDNIKEYPPEIIKYGGTLCLAQTRPREDRYVIGGCGGDPIEIPKVLVLSVFDAMARKGINCLQRR